MIYFLFNIDFIMVNQKKKDFVEKNVASQINMADIIKTFKGDLTKESILNWLNQFDIDEQVFIEKLLLHYKYFSSNDVVSSLVSLFKKLVNEFGINPEKTWFIPMGYVAKSGNAIAYFFRRFNMLSEQNFLRLSDITLEKLKEKGKVVFLDDFIGSGKYASKVLSDLVENLKIKDSQFNFIYASIIGYSDGIEFVKKTEICDVCVNEELNSQSNPFSEDSLIYDTSIEKDTAKNIMIKYGSLLWQKFPLGYGGTQGLISFFYSTPNNTFPIFWKSEGTWKALLPNGPSIRDTTKVLNFTEIEPEKTTCSKDIKNNGDFFTEICKSEEATTAVYKCFQKFNVMFIITKAFHDIGIKEEIYQDVTLLIDRLKGMKHEREVVRSALLFPHADKLADIRGKLFFQVEPCYNVKELDNISLLSQIVDGVDGAMVVSPSGEIIGCHLFRSDHEIFIDSVLPIYHNAAIASKEANGILILFLGNNNAIIFHNGNLILSMKNSKWFIKEQLKERLQLEINHKLKENLISKILHVCSWLSSSQKGALFTLGDSIKVLEYAGKKGPDEYRWEKINAFSCDTRALFSIAKQDGATIIDKDGNLVGSMVILRPPADSIGKEEKSKGARHDSASKISAVTNALAICVSEDGPITVYSEGQVILRIHG